MKTSLGFSWLLQVAVVLIIAPMAALKFVGDERTVEVFETLGMEPNGRLLIGAIEAFAVILLLIPWSVTWGALLAWGVMTGALIGHATHLGVTGAMLPMTLMALVAWLMTSVIVLLRRDQLVFIRHMFSREGSPIEPDGD